VTTGSSHESVRATPRLRLTVASGDELVVRTFTVRESISSLFTIQLVVLSDDPDLDFSSIVGHPATFQIERARASAPVPQRRWTGVVTQLEQLGVEEQGPSTYALTLMPALWLLTQRRNYRIFQQRSEPDIALQILREWGIEPALRIDAASYELRQYRVQYAESDFAFVSRVLEDAGVSYFFEDDPSGETKLVLADSPHGAPPRAEPLPWVATPSDRLDQAFVTGVRVMQQVRPGRYTVRDHDYRRAADFDLSASAEGGDGVETRLERFHYVPGAFLFQSERPGDTPVADDRGAARHAPSEGARIAQNRLDAKRGAAHSCVFETSATELRPGQTIRITGHPRRDLSEARALLLVANSLRGGSTEPWAQQCEARFTDVPFRPALSTPKPRTQGMESATVVGPAGEEIHTDELGRVRVHFHWDRDGERNERSSCWVHVSQPSAGAGFGSLTIPRVGQEVLVDFLAGDPDRPVVVGRVFTNLQKVPYELPKHKMVSGMRSESTPKTSTARATAGAAAAALRRSPLLGGEPMSPQEVAEEVLKSRNFRAVSPDATAHGWAGNELTFDDSAGQEKVYLQAYKDLNALVNNAWTTLIGHFRSTKVGSDDILTVRNKQQTVVGSDRSVSVGGDQRHSVTGDAFQFVEKNQIFKSELNTTVLAKETRVNSQDITVLTCGSSTIVMHPDYIVIQGKDVFINPGEAETAAAANGVRPPPQHARDAARDAAEQPIERAYWALEEAAAQGGKGSFPTFDSARDWVMTRYPILDENEAALVVRRFFRG